MYNGFKEAVERGKDFPIPPISELLFYPREVRYRCEGDSSPHCDDCIARVVTRYYRVGEEPKKLELECPVFYRTPISPEEKIPFTLMD